ncbi:MAG: gamma-glutamylcyclotransferase [Proteobacteria bacterium]|nr:gamma-glutamylcyclotransferase [Pseudomonadota bacterium]
MPPYFFYGTLRDMDVLRAVLRRPIDCFTISEALADGYRAAPVVGSDYSVLVPDASHVSAGIVVFGLALRDIRRLDWFEGRDYTTASIDVLLIDSEQEVTANLYAPAKNVRTEKGVWDFDAWRHRHKRKFIAMIRRGNPA